MLNGSKEFCQEFMTDVRVPDHDRIGEVDGGWTVGTRWMFHERMLLNSPYVISPVGAARGSTDTVTVQRVVEAAGLDDEPRARDLVAQARVLELVGESLQERISEGLRSGTLPEQAAAVGRLFKGVAAARVTTLALEAAGAEGAAWDDEDEAGRCAIEFLMRQSGSIGGGTLEMARNVISERMLGMPRERAVDRDVPFRDVPRPRPADR
jgi:alkylation response protein AidB-like acyl-CoA dehydrogenase